MQTPVPERSLPETSAGDYFFKTTHWSVVLEAGQSGSADAAAALGKLCQTYWYPLYAYVRRLGHAPEDAQDLTQEFFARLIAKEHLHGLEPHKGKFRCFLVVALKRFLANEWERANRQKRGGGRQVLSLDEPGVEERYQAELVDQKTPEKLLDQCWATTLLEQSLGRLSAEMESDGKGRLFEQLKPFLSANIERNSYPETAARLGMTEGNLRVNIHRLRQRYRELLRLEIAATVETPEAVDEEIRELFAALS
jgi:RNA polymerase sigma-70 factor (ECF subfamily)